MKRIAALTLSLLVASAGAVCGADNTSEQEGLHKQKLLETLVRFDPDEKIYGYNPSSNYGAEAGKDQQCQLFRLDDLHREKAVGKLELLKGNGFVYPLIKVSREELERLYGKSRDRIYVSPGTGPFNTLVNRAHEEPDQSRRIFDLLAIDKINQPKIFHLTVTFKDGLADTYTVDGPGIRQIFFKHIAEPNKSFSDKQEPKSTT